jgi:hypothetical protein
MMNKLIFLGLIPILVLLVPNVYASTEPGARERIDCDENGDHSWCNGGRGRDGLPFCDLSIPAQGCYDRTDNSEDYCSEYSQSDLKFCIENAIDVTCGNEGYDDGENHPFNQDTYEKCGRGYYDAFLEGCMSAGNTEENCERFTDV